MSLDFLWRAQIALNVPITRLWFLLEHPIQVPDESTIEAVLSDLLERQRPVTCEQVLEAVAECLQVPLWAVTSGMRQKRVNQVRTAAALVVESMPQLKLSDLAKLVCRTRRHLLWARRQAQKKAGEDFWKKVAAIREEIESL